MRTNIEQQKNMTKSLILLTYFFKNMALFACFVDFCVLPYMYKQTKRTNMKKYTDILTETKKYTVTWEVDYDNGYKTIANVVMAKDEKEAEKVSEKQLDKYVEKRAKQMGTGVNEVQLDSVNVYNSKTDGNLNVNGFKEYNKA